MSIHGKATQVLMAGVDISTWLNSISPSGTLEAAETSGFQQESKTYIPGLTDDSVSFGGRFQGSLASVEALVQANILSEASPIVTIGWGMGITKGDPVLFGVGLHTTLGVTSPVGDVIAVTGDVQYDGGVYDGVHIATSALISTDSETATYDPGTAVAGTKLAVGLHLVENTHDGDATVRVEHSADGSVWADLATFATIATEEVGSELIVLGGAVNRYLRVGVVLVGLTGGVRPLVVIGRQ